MKFRNVVATLALACGFAANANAVTLTGSIGIIPLGVEWAFDGTCTSTADCNGFTLSSDPGLVAVNQGSGSFEGMIGTLGTMTSVNVGSLPIAPLWSLANGYSFDLTSATIDEVDNDLTDGNGRSLVIFGTGYIIAPDLSQTFAKWSFSGDNSGTGALFNFSTTNDVVATPEPGSLALLSLGLLTVGAFSRRRKAG